MNISVIKNPDDLYSLKEEWNLLVNEASDATLFQTWEWCISWFETYGLLESLFIVIGREAGSLVAIAPFVLTTKRLLFRDQKVLSFIGADNKFSDYCSFVCAEDSPRRLSLMLQWLMTDNKEWDVLDLRNIQEHTKQASLIFDQFSQNGFYATSRYQSDAPRINLLTSEAKDLPKRKSLKRHYNWFEKNGALEIKFSTGAQDISNDLSEFFNQHQDRWADTPSPSIFRDPLSRKFFQVLTNKMEGTPWLHFTKVTHNKQPIAFHFGFIYKDTFIWYKPSFDPSLAKKSPGEVLLKSLFEFCLAKKLATFDFTIGNESFKYRFADSVNRIIHLQIFKSRTNFLLAKGLLRIRALRRWCLALRRKAA